MKLASAFVSILALSASAFAEGAPVTWKSKKFTTATVPADVPAAARDAIAQWSDWAGTSGYRLDLDPTARVLLVSSAKPSTVANTLRVVARGIEMFDAMLPAPPRKATADSDTPTPPAPQSGGIPEDPESAPAPVVKAEKPKAAPAKTAVAPWGSGSITPDTHTATLIVVDGEPAYRELVVDLARRQAYLKKWSEDAVDQTGFTLEQPLAGAFVVGAAVQEEWNYDHEVLNRVVQLLTLRRFGQQPNWIVQGIAWAAEMRLDETVYCFPYRDEFVYTVEHGSWPTDLRALWKDRADQPLTIAELAGWKRATWDGVAAKLSWGVVEHMLGQPSKFAAALEDLRVLRDRDNRRVTGANTWERIPDWEIPASKQLPALEGQLGAGLLKNASDAFSNIGKAKEKAASAGANRSKSKDSARR